MVWPLLEVIDESLDEDWCKTLATHLGHFETGDEKASCGRAGATRSRAASRDSSRPTPASGRNCSSTGRRHRRRRSPADLALATAAVAGAGRPHRRRPAARPARENRCALQESPTDLPQRLSLFGHTRLPITEIELIEALATHHDLHLWLPHPSDDLWRELAGDRTAPIPRRDDTSHRAVAPSAAGHPRPGSARAAAQPARRPRQPTNTSAAPRPPRHPARLAAVRHRRECRSATGPHARRRPTAPCRCTLPRPGPAGRRAARGAARPARRRPDAGAARHPGHVPRHRDLRAADQRRLRARRRAARRAPRAPAADAARRSLARPDQSAARRRDRNCSRWPAAG